MRIDKWKFVPCVNTPEKAFPAVVEGKLFGHPKIKDGSTIVTSPIEVMEGTWVMDTDGNTYELGIKG
jgi:hypothetical protein